MQTEILGIREENINEKFINPKAFIQVLDKDSSASSFLIECAPTLTVTRKTDRLIGEF